MRRITRIAESRLRNIISETVREYIAETMYDEQWDKEIRLFFGGIEKYNAVIGDGYIAVPYVQSEDEHRYIIYERGSGCLRDDNFMLQHSRRLSKRELGAIAAAFDRNGFDPYDCMGDDYYEAFE